MKLAVYCGSTPGYEPAYTAAARALGEWMGRNGHELVFGGSHTGLMGAVADGVLSVGGTIIGVVPNVPEIRARAHPRLTTRIDTETMAERKSKMIALAEAFLALPGGLGTLDEITEILSLQSLGLVRGPVIFYNTGGYYEPMKPVLANILQNGFGRPEFFEHVVFADSPDSVGKVLRKRS